MNKKEQVKEKSTWYIDNRNQRKYEQKLPNEFLPESVQEGYAIQKLLISSMKDVVAWKLGGGTKSTREIFNTSDIYYGPIFKGHLFRSGSNIPLEILGSPKGEAEISFRLSEDISDITKYKEDPWKLVDAIAPSIELPASVVEDVPKYGLPVLLADGCAYGALVIGDHLDINDRIKNKINTLELSFSSEEKLIKGNASNILTTPIGAIYDFIKLAIENGENIRAGQWVATGGCTPCVKLPINHLIKADFGELGNFSFRVIEK